MVTPVWLAQFTRPGELTRGKASPGDDAWSPTGFERKRLLNEAAVQQKNLNQCHDSQEPQCHSPSSSRNDGTTHHILTQHQIAALQ
jgi:hypothetical protein